MAKTSFDYHNIKIFTKHHDKVKEHLSQEFIFHGHNLWKSSFVLMDFMATCLSDEESNVINNVLDVGCGWGHLTCFLAKNFNATCTSVDADKNIEPILNYFCKENNVSTNFLNKSIKDITVEDLSGIDTIVGSDICFWESLTVEWLELIEKSLEANVQQIYIADPIRDPFNDLVEYCDDIFEGNCELWEHEITMPNKTYSQILELNLRG